LCLSGAKFGRSTSGHAKGAPGVGGRHPVWEADRALIGVIPHTTATRGSQFEVVLPVRFLSEGAFLVQGIQALPPKYFQRRLGVLNAEQLRRVEECLMHWLGLRA